MLVQICEHERGMRLDKRNRLGCILLAAALAIALTVFLWMMFSGEVSNPSPLSHPVS